VYVLRLELGIIDFLESMARHLPQAIALRLELFIDHWREKVKLRMLEQLERMHKDIDSLRRELSEIKSITRKMKHLPEK